MYCRNSVEQMRKFWNSGLLWGRNLVFYAGKTTKYLHQKFAVHVWYCVFICLFKSASPCSSENIKAHLLVAWEERQVDPCVLHICSSLLQRGWYFWGLFSETSCLEGLVWCGGAMGREWELLCFPLAQQQPTHPGPGHRQFSSPPMPQGLSPPQLLAMSAARSSAPLGLGVSVSCHYLSGFPSFLPLHSSLLPSWTLDMLNSS